MPRGPFCQTAFKSLLTAAACLPACRSPLLPLLTSHSAASKSHPPPQPQASQSCTSLQQQTNTMGFISDRFNLEKQVTFYMSYHDNKTNQLIHFACIWPIFISGVMILAQTEPLFAQPSFLASLPFSEYMVMNYSLAMAAVYMIWYILLDPIAGSLGATIIFGVYLFANYFETASPTLFGVPAWQVALPIHVFAWIAQFIGHGVFERRKPALLDSLDQALITAPMFVLLEALFPLGYRPKLYARVMKQVKINVKAFHGAKTL